MAFVKLGDPRADRKIHGTCGLQRKDKQRRSSRYLPSNERRIACSGGYVLFTAGAIRNNSAGEGVFRIVPVKGSAARGVKPEQVTVEVAGKQKPSRRRRKRRDHWRGHPFCQRARPVVGSTAVVHPKAFVIG